MDNSKKVEALKSVVRNDVSKEELQELINLVTGKKCYKKRIKSKLSDIEKYKSKKSYIKVYIDDKMEDEYILQLLKKKKNKKYYPKEFIEKRKILLKNARSSNGCTECNDKNLLQVHHIDKDINNNRINNLKVLCYSCHSRYHIHLQGKKPPKWLK